MYLITQSESNASRRVIYLSLFSSNGTSPAQFETGGQPEFSIGGVNYGNTSATLISIDSTQGEYALVLTSSEVSVLGQGAVRYSSTSALPWSTPFQVIVPDLGASLSTFNASTDSVGLKAVSHSGATILGVTRLDSSVTLRDAAYSAVTVRIDPIEYSGLTISGVGRVDSSVTPANGLYSAITVRIEPIAYSGLTVDARIAATLGAGAVDATALATDAGQDIADRVLLRNIEGGDDSGRSVGQALGALRNRNQLSDVSYIVYRNDDTAIWWHASIATTGDTVRVTDVNPA